MNVRDLGDYIRNQRVSAKLSLRGMSGLAGVSIPYLSQIERGLRRPSADVLQAIAKGLRISAEQLYIKAGILEDRSVAEVAAAIVSDLFITERQKQALLQIYEAFREETGRAVLASEPQAPAGEVPAAHPAEAPAVSKAPAKSKARTGTHGSATGAPKASGNGTKVSRSSGSKPRRTKREASA
jgi:transcriptional regulator with XRE-family HTH domain